MRTHPDRTVILLENLYVEEVNHAERRTPQDGVLPIAGV